MPVVARILSSLWLALCLSAGLSVFGQYRFDNWSTDNGLPQNGVRQITQTPEGYLWFTTFDGLVRFDGLRFTTFNKSNTKGIINNRFTNIFATEDGTIYATTMEDGILTVYRDKHFKTFTSDQVPGHYIASIEYEETGGVRFLVEDDGRKSKSWYRLENDKFAFIETSNGAQYSFIGPSGTRWTIGTEGVTAERGDVKSFTPLDLGRLGYRPKAFEDSAGNLWFGENRVHRISNGELRTFDEKDGLPANSLYHSFWQDADGSVWFASGGASSASIGLVRFQGETFQFFGKDAGLTAHSIQSVFIDREGTTWLATDRGLFRRRKQVIQAFSTESGIDHSEVYPLFRDSKDQIWIGSSRGLSIYRDGRFEVSKVHSSPGTPPNRAWRPDSMSVQALWEDPSGKMWVGVSGGLYTVKDGIAEPVFTGSHVFAVQGDNAGNVWAATNKGILKFNDYRQTAHYTTKDGLPNEFMNLIFQDSKGQLWFGGLGGLSRFEEGKFVNYTTTDGLAGNYIRTIYEDKDGTLWIGTYDEGLSRLRDGKFASVKEKDGLFNSGVFAIQEDEAGNFWISSNRGVYRVRKQELEDFAAGRISKINSVGYGKEDGMLSNECNGGRQPSSVRDRDGRFWFPTQAGVAIVDPKAERSNPIPPSVVIEEVLVERQPIDWTNEIAVNPGQRDVEIRFTGISLIKSSQVKFQYKLEGHDEDWVDAGTERSAVYSYLPPGAYTFHVRAANSDGVWNMSGTRARVVFMPFFYQTRMFIFVCVLVAALLLLVVWKASVYQLEARERKLSRLVAARTVELASANKHLEDLAHSDGLTKIGNRRRFESFLSDEWHRAIRFRTPISLALIDIDHFKLYNDTYGHQAGDECLQRVAETFADTIKRPTDLVARFGGEEFAMVLGGTDAAGARMIAEQAVKSLESLNIPHAASTTSSSVTVSIGIATIHPTLESTEAELIGAADRALYQAKADGRNQMYVDDLTAAPPVGGIVTVREHLEIRLS